MTEPLKIPRGVSKVIVISASGKTEKVDPALENIVDLECLPDRRSKRDRVRPAPDQKISLSSQ